MYLFSGQTGHIHTTDESIYNDFVEGRIDTYALLSAEKATNSDDFLAPPPYPSRSDVLSDVEKSLDSEIQQLMLGITDACNLRCDYCVYSGSFDNRRSHGNKHVGWSVAKKAIDLLLIHCSKSGLPPGVAFYGGEPLQSFDMIKQCIEYTRDKTNNKALFTVTTNGTMLKGQCLEYLVKNDVSLAISIDGPQEIHDRNRKTVAGKPTFEDVYGNIISIKNKHPLFFKSRVRFSVVLSPPVNLDLLRLFFDEIGQPCVLNPLESYGSNINWDRTPVDKKQLSALFSDFERVVIDCDKRGRKDQMSHFSVCFLAPSLRAVSIRRLRPQSAYNFLGQCIPGVRKFFVNPVGEIYPCEKVEGSDSLALGDVNSGIDPLRVTDLMIKYANIIRDECKDCWMRRLCVSCLADAVDGSRVSLDKMRNQCDFRRSAQSDILGLYAHISKKRPGSLSFLDDMVPRSEA